MNTLYTLSLYTLISTGPAGARLMLKQKKHKTAPAGPVVLSRVERPTGLDLNDKALS